MQKALIFSQVWLTFSPMTMVDTYHQNESADRRKRSSWLLSRSTDEQELAFRSLKGAAASRSENRVELQPRTQVVVGGEGSGSHSRMEVGAGDGCGIKRRA
jgi:hypothetical protein